MTASATHAAPPVSMITCINPSPEEDPTIATDCATSGSRSFSCTESIDRTLHDSNVRVSVGGTPFSFSRHAFGKLSKLPWKCDINGILHLATSAAVFELLLDYTLFDTLPAYDLLDRREFEELETLALGSGYHALIAHFHRPNSYMSVQELKRASSHTTNDKGSCPVLLQDLVATGRCARWWSACSFRRQRRRKRTDTSDTAAAKRPKWTHGQWCSASSVVS